MKKSIRDLKRQTMSAEPVPASEVRRSKRLKVGVVSSLAGEHNSGWSRIHEDVEFTEKSSGTNLTSDEEDALINQYRYYLGYENIVGVGVEQRRINGKERDLLVFLVVRKKKVRELPKSERIPKKVWLDIKDGRRVEIDTVVEETGEIVPQGPEGGDAVGVVNSPNSLGICTIGAIMPFPVEDDGPSDSPIRLVTSAHLIDYAEQHKGKMLYYLKRDYYKQVEQNPRSSFVRQEQRLFPITNFYPVEKHDHELTIQELANAEDNELDVLWADVDPGLRNQGTHPIAGRYPVGIRAPRRGEYFNMYGIKSGMHRGKICLRKFILQVPHKDTGGRVIYYTYWKNMYGYKLENPSKPGDSGTALMSDDDYVIGLHSFGSEDGKTGYACRLQSGN